jgi:hypothetical protein
MKLTLKEIVAASKELDTLLHQNVDVKLSYKIAKIKQEIDKYANLATSKNDEMIVKHGTPIENLPGQYNVPHEILTQLNEMWNTEEELNIETISLNELSNIQLPPKFFINMGSVISE